GGPRRRAARARRPVPPRLGGSPGAGGPSPGPPPPPPGYPRVPPAAVPHPRAAATADRAGHPPGRRTVQPRLRGAAARADPVLHPHRRDRRAARPAGRERVRPDGRRHAAAGDGPYPAACRAGAPWPDGRPGLRDVLPDGELRAVARCGVGVAVRTGSRAGQPLRGRSRAGGRGRSGCHGGTGRRGYLRAADRRGTGGTQVRRITGRPPFLGTRPPPTRHLAFGTVMASVLWTSA